MNSKHSIVFFSAGVILILVLFLMDVPMNVMPESLQNQIVESNLNVQQQDDDQNILQEEYDIIKPIQKKFVEQMNCTELNQFILSFEKGWGSVIPMYNEKCS
ncbi:MAG: hypothetical protein OEL52_01155 [Nitrosopumilus sp.]|nr:hypothetical protein [Nitrosopumilus sp.]